MTQRRLMSRERLTGVRARKYNTDMGPDAIRSGGARSACARGPLRGAMPLNPGDGGRPRSGQSLQERLLCSASRWGGRTRPPSPRVVTGVNHPTRCDRLLYPASTSPPASDEACRASTPTVILRQRVRPGGRGRERPPGRLPGRPGARRSGVPHPVPGARHRGGRGHHERGAPGQGHRVEPRPAAARVDPGLCRPPDLRQRVLRLSERVTLDAVRRRRPRRGHHHPALCQPVHPEAGRRVPAHRL